MARDHDQLNHLVEKALHGEDDSDRHLITLFAIALASRGKTYVELGVRDGTTTLPILMAAHLNGGILTSVDVQATTFECPTEHLAHWRFVQSDALDFLHLWPPQDKIDFILLDDWHSYEHVSNELALLDKQIGPSSVILLHDLMRGGHEPHYHCDLTVKTGTWANGGPYRAVAELDPSLWEWATLPWDSGLTLLRKKWSTKYHKR